MLTLMLAAALPQGCRVISEEGTEVCPAHLPARRRVTVDAVGQGTRWRASDEPPCSRFRPSAANVSRFLARAERTDPSSVHHTLAESPCYASGRIAFTDGRKGTYRLTRLSLMYLTIGRGPEIILYCPNCEFGGLAPG